MNGELVVVDDLPGEFAERVIEAFHGRPEEEFSLCLSGGETARQCYERLATDGAEQIDWWAVDVYWGDERCVPPDHEDSNERLGRQAVLEKVGAAHAVYPMRCDEGPDPYQLRIGELGRIDLVHLGLGPDGHNASLFPGSPRLPADPRPPRPPGLPRPAGRPQRGSPRPPPSPTHDVHLLGAVPGPADHLH